MKSRAELLAEIRSLKKQLADAEARNRQAICADCGRVSEEYEGREAMLAAITAHVSECKEVAKIVILETEELERKLKVSEEQRIYWHDIACKLGPMLHSATKGESG